MNPLDWFKGKPDLVPEASPPTPEVPAGHGRRLPLDRSAMFDVERTPTLRALLDRDRDERDPSWSNAFWENAWTASISISASPIFIGPDGFPYLRLDIPNPGPFDSQCLANLASNCLDNLTGAAFFRSPDEPPEAAAFVASLGVIDSLLRYDSPDGDPIDVAERREGDDPNLVRKVDGQLIVEREHQVLYGAPSADFLSKPQTRSLHRHLTQGWKIDNPRVGLMVSHALRPSRNLVIGRKRSEFAADEPIDAMANALMWNLNPGRAIILQPEDMPSSDLVELSSLA